MELKAKKRGAFWRKIYIGARLPLFRRNNFGAFMEFGSQPYTPYHLQQLSYYLAGSSSYSILPAPSVLAPFNPSDSYILPNVKGRSPFLTDSLDFLIRDKTQENSDPLGGLFAGRKEFLSKSVEDILGLIDEREQIRYGNLRQIDYESLKTNSRLLEFKKWQHGLNPQFEKTRSDLERNLIGFEHEKRMEQVASWRDITRLRSELREVMGEVAREKNRQTLLSDTTQWTYKNSAEN